MPLDQETDLDIVVEFFLSLTVFLDRPTIQIQLVAILISVIVSVVLTRFIRHIIDEHLPIVTISEAPMWRRVLFTAEHQLLPVILLLTNFLTEVLLIQQGFVFGLVVLFSEFIWLYVLYQLFVGVLYGMFLAEDVNRFHYRIFLPLFILYCVFEFLANITDVSMLWQAIVARLFNNPISVGALLVTTVGLYLWVDIIFGVLGIVQRMIAAYTEIDQGTVMAVLTIGRYVLIGIGILIAMNSLNLDPTAIAAVGGGLSLGIGIGLQSIVGNFVSGIILLFERSIRPGDVIVVDGIFGTVQELQIRSTVVRTFDNVDLIIPNSKLFESTVTSYTRTDRIVRVRLDMGVSYKSDPKQVMEIILSVAKSHGLVRDTPEPVVLFRGFGDSSLDFRVMVWLNDVNYMLRVPSELHAMIFDEFKKQNIEIPFPQRDLHIRTGFPPYEKEVV